MRCAQGKRKPNVHGAKALGGPPCSRYLAAARGKKGENEKRRKKGKKEKKGKRAGVASKTRLRLKGIIRIHVALH